MDRAPNRSTIAKCSPSIIYCIMPCGWRLNRQCNLRITAMTMKDVKPDIGQAFVVWPSENFRDYECGIAKTSRCMSTSSTDGADSSDTNVRWQTSSQPAACGMFVLRGRWRVEHSTFNTRGSPSQTKFRRRFNMSKFKVVWRTVHLWRSPSWLQSRIILDKPSHILNRARSTR